MPPVDNSIMNIINQLEIKSGLEIHGLLVGKNSSVPLNHLCTNWDGQNRVYNFLCKFDPLTILREYNSNNNNNNNNNNFNNMKSASSMSLSSISSSVSLTKRFSRKFKLYAKNYENDDNDNNKDNYNKIFDNAKINVNSIIHDIQYTIEKDQPNTSIFNETLMKILEGLNDGLIERETECQLLLLSAVCSEHILFIGPPGTGKSLIARRLSMLINGQFFERLLTKVFIFIINFY
jgi:hypothetical protein